MALTCAINVSGSSVGTTCVSYTNCDVSCCTKTYGSCSGTTTGCSGKTNAQCTAMGACCHWAGTPATCNSVTCVGMSEGNCGTCAGCTKAGTCPKKTCGAVATTDLLLCTGCDTCASNKATISGAIDLTGYWSVYVGSVGDFSATDTISFDATHTLNIGY